ncbi:MAG: phosphoribosylglycinamide formyltransferase [Phycisphaerales bacterium JB038]
MLKLATLISGGGRTVLNLQERIERGELDARIELVIASRKNITGIERARRAGLPVEVVPRRSFADTESFSVEIWRVIDASLTPADGLVVLAGFLSLLRIPDAWAARVINIHPALLPNFGGKGMYGERVHAAVLAAGEQESGCTVHFADARYDQGPIIGQKRCPVLPGDDAESLAARVFELDCQLYPAVVRAFAEDRISLKQGRVLIQGEL